MHGIQQNLHYETIQKNHSGFARLGYDAIPLQPEGFLPIVKEWASQDPAELWDHAPENVNIGIVCGGLKRIAVIECGVGENENSYKNIVDWLDRLGIRQGSYPVVHSPLNITRHIYISLDDDLPGDSYPLSPEIGEGSLFYGPKSYVIAPPSATINGEYKLLNGDFTHLPVLRVDQIINLLDLPIIPSWVQEGSKPLTTNELSRIPARVMSLIQGNGVDTYKDGLELEQAIAISLIKNGYSDSQILSIFLHFPLAGKFIEMTSNNIETGFKWLRLLIESSRELLISNKSIDYRLAKEAIAWAEASPWSGRTGSTDQAVLIAHASIALRRGQLIYGASAREIAELSGLSRTTASRRTQSLIEDGRIRLVEPTVGFQANVYDLIVDVHNGTVLSNDCHVMHSHDVFRWKGLGKSAALVWHALNQKDSLTVAELEAITGKHQSTIRRRLKKMASIQDPVTGESIPMVVEIDQKGANRWRALDVDLEHVAKILGTEGTGDEQKLQHKREQTSFKKIMNKRQAD